MANLFFKVSQRRFIFSLKGYIAYLAYAVALVGMCVAVIQIIMGVVTLFDLVLLLIFYVLSVSGITVGFHRFFAHKSFETSKPVKIILGILGSMAGQGGVIVWASNHRCHHRFTDVDGDPHSPGLYTTGTLRKTKAFFHAYIGWTVQPRLINTHIFGRDLCQDLIVVRLNKYYYVWLLLGIVIPAILGAMYYQSPIGAFHGLIWGGAFRLFLAYLSIYGIAAISHLRGFGSRPFKENTGNSNNSTIMAVAALGEGWHNNHHAFPRSARFGLYWWQIDVGYYWIFLLEKLGLVWDVEYVDPELIRAKNK